MLTARGGGLLPPPLGISRSTPSQPLSSWANARIRPAGDGSVLRSTWLSLAPHARKQCFPVRAATLDAKHSKSPQILSCTSNGAALAFAVRFLLRNKLLAQSRWVVKTTGLRLFETNLLLPAICTPNQTGKGRCLHRAALLPCA